MAAGLVQDFRSSAHNQVGLGLEKQGSILTSSGAQIQLASYPIVLGTNQTWPVEPNSSGPINYTLGFSV